MGRAICRLLSSGSAFQLPPSRRRRRLVSLTPLIDVVFLLLIFFMLASRFAVETRIDLASGGRGEAYKGAPRLVSVGERSLALNGAPIDLGALSSALEALVSDKSQVVVLRAEKDADVQRIVVVIDTLKAAGFERLALIE